MALRTDKQFEEWLRVAVPYQSRDPRFAVRRADLSDFDRIYDVVDAAFGVKRPRSQYDWLYRGNPHGTARCWIVVEKSSQRIVSSGGEFPWPVQAGTEPMPGSLGGDGVTAPGWQRQGISQLRYEVREAHPWYATTAFIGWANDNSRGAMEKHGGGESASGSVPKGVLLLRTAGLFRRRGRPSPLTTIGDRLGDALLEAWRGVVLGRPTGVLVEPVRRFDAAFNEVTEREMASPRFWCPHDAEFLNWRYLAHPVKEYRAFAATRGDLPVAYGVVQIGGETAWLMEFAAPRPPSPVAHALLAQIIIAARNAGCLRLNVIAPPGWRHWHLLRRAGFLRRPSNMFFLARGRGEPEVCHLENWQFVPGDTDML